MSLTFEEMKELLALCWEYDINDDLDWYPEKDGSIEFSIRCNDLFAWGCADCTEIESKEDIDLLRKCLDEIPREDLDRFYVSTDLYCARKRKCRPQGACYSNYPEKYWHLFDACGEERETGFGNPYKPGEYKSIEYQQKEIEEANQNRNLFKKVVDKLLFRC